MLEGSGDRERKAAGIASAIRRAGDYRWAGVYEVTEEEIDNIAFDGPGAPAHSRFCATQGLSGSAVASGDRRCGRREGRPALPDGLRLHPLGDHRPGRGPSGTEGRGHHRRRERKGGRFSEEDRAALERCAVALAELFG